jgi:hypothetical protein
MDSEVLEDEFDGPSIFGSSPEQRRRRYIRLALCGVAILVVIVVILSVVLTNQQASAPSTSRLFEFQVGNLDGDDSQTGSISIRTIPEWAPIGVDRFHVSVLCCS